MTVRREGNKVWIEGVPALAEPGLKVPWLARTSKTCTFAHTLEAALAVTEQPVSFAEILALSGMAFRTRWYDGDDGPTGCPCAPVGETPDVKERLPAAIGWQFEEFAADGWDKPRMQPARAALVQSIDAGIPVPIVDRHLNSIVAYGYIGDGDVLMLRSQSDGDYESGYAGLGQNPSLVHILRGPEPRPPLRDVVAETVRDAAERWFVTESEFIPGRLKNGRAALDAWMRGLEQHESLATKVDPGRLLFYHLWAYKHLWDARRAAAGFLAQHVSLFPEAAADIRAAAELYQREADLLGSAYDDSGTYLGSFEHLGACIGSSGHEDTDASYWTPAMRVRERVILQQCLALEGEAVAKLGDAAADMAP